MTDDDILSWAISIAFAYRDDLGSHKDPIIRVKEKLKQFTSAVESKAKEKIKKECADICYSIGMDKYKLYKGREPYKGNEEGRADPYVSGQSDGADLCGDAIMESGK